MASSPSYMLRAVSAFALMIGFYVLALIIAGALLLLVCADLTTGSGIHLRLIFFGLVGAGTILWSIVPRADRFEPPGPRLEPSQQGRLFRDLQQVAEATGQQMPGEVYLVPEVNAWVAQRGGVLGFGGRRVMGLGLPLLQGLTRAEMRAVIGHEFGHFHGGDTKLGPVLYRTRSAIGRTIQGVRGLLQAPFRWYGTMFLKITHATSRRQEYSADALSARLFGSRALMDGLKKLPGLAQAFPAYWEQELMPALRAGYRPPISSGFESFVAHPTIAEQVRRVQDQALGESAGNPYDTHPPLPDRLRALQALPPGPEVADEGRASALLDGIEGLERELLAHMYGEEPAARLQPLAWEQAAEKVFLPSYRRQVQEQRAALEGVTPGDFPALARDPSPVGGKLAIRSGEPVPKEARDAYALQLLGSALALALHDRGWSMRAGPGQPLTLEMDGRSVAPFAALGAMQRQGFPAERWTSAAAEGGYRDLPLAEAGPGT